ncbi:hypothetical protein F5X99DRAFT_379915 [Biscogniauxia marginata]|nr:hypothetical protein F5X99DRAFT_379915 [Biscogniauxia marginata]
MQSGGLYRSVRLVFGLFCPGFVRAGWLFMLRWWSEPLESRKGILLRGAIYMKKRVPSLVSMHLHGRPPCLVVKGLGE